MRWLKFVALLLFVVSFGAQAQDDTCPDIVDAALSAVGDACGTLGLDLACYGHPQLDADFWEPRDDLTFNTPSDMVPVIDLQMLRTVPLDLDSGAWGVAVMNLQANLPDTMLAPGQGVTFLLMGDATLENEVPPDEAAEPVEPVPASTTARVNLRSGPTTAANIVETVDAGTPLILVGVSASRAWYQTEAGDWVYSEYLTADDPATQLALPVTDEAADAGPRYGPMQAFYFSAGIGLPVCNEAPNALVVQNPAGVEVTFNMNGLEVELGSTMVLTLGRSDGRPALMMTLMEGTLSARFGETRFTLDEPGQAAGVTLDDRGRVSPDSSVVMPDVDMLLQKAMPACQAAAQSGLFEPTDCDFQVVAYELPEICTVTATRNINRRGGPSTIYDVWDGLAQGESAIAEGQVVGFDGYVWWQLEDGSWVREDLVEEVGPCADLPAGTVPATPTPIPTPVPTATPPPTPEPEAVVPEDVEIWVRACHEGGGDFGSPVPANVPLTVVMHISSYTAEAANQSDSYFDWYLYIDDNPFGAPARVPQGRTVYGYWSLPSGLTPGVHLFSVEEYFFAYWETMSGQVIPSGLSDLIECRVNVQ